jgi:hypothetical protein
MKFAKVYVAEFVKEKVRLPNHNVNSEPKTCLCDHTAKFIEKRRIFRRSKAASEHIAGLQKTKLSSYTDNRLPWRSR